MRQIAKAYRLGPSMSKFEKESLSALLDGEADDLELRRLLKAMEKEPELAQRWERYHLAQSVLHDRGIEVSSSLVVNVAEAIQAEPALAASVSTNGRWQQQLSRLAIAACVAIVAVVALQPNSTQTTAPAVVQETTATQLETVPESMLAEAVAPAELDPAAQQRLREYIEAMSFDPEDPVRMEHIENSPLFRLVNEYQAQP